MSEPCCQHGATSGRPPIVRRGVALAGWIVPSTILALMPKCPMCVAAYLTLATGIGVSAATAGAARIVLIAMCVGSLTYLVVRQVMRWITKTQQEGN